MLIGISGAAGAGKDTFADMLAKALRAHDEWVVRDRFAATLKASAAAALGVAPELLEAYKRDGTMKIMFDSPTQKTTGKSITVREFLQWYGTEAHREIFGPDFWVDDLVRRHRAVGKPHIRILSDCRFSNEARAVVENGGRIYFVMRPDVNEIGREHASEDFSWANDIEHPASQGITHIGNLGTLEDLQARAEQEARALVAPV